MGPVMNCRVSSVGHIIPTMYSPRQEDGTFELVCVTQDSFVSNPHGKWNYGASLLGSVYFPPHSAFCVSVD